jgi:putative redox protein
MHAPLDDVVEVDNAAALFLAAKYPKSFISLDAADHLLSRSEDSFYVGHVLAAWASRYLPDREVPAELGAKDGDVLARTFIGGFCTNVRAGRHALIADEPLHVRGTDRGPSPYDLLSAALASCTTMTLKMYASLKKLKLRSTTVRVMHDKVHAEDCADCDTDTGKIDEFRREISIDGDLSDDDITRLLEIADRCPVHRTLHSEVRVRSTLV